MGKKAEVSAGAILVVTVGILALSRRSGGGSSSGLVMTPHPAEPLSLALRQRSAGLRALPTGFSENTTGNYFSLTITNTSVFTGTTTLAPYTFTYNAAYTAGSLALSWPGASPYYYSISLAAGETKTVNLPTFAIAVGALGITPGTSVNGTATAALMDIAFTTTLKSVSGTVRATALAVSGAGNIAF